MSMAVDLTNAAPQGAKHFDVLIVGAGISGIDAAYHLQKECPGKSFVLLETQETFGGTWNTHKYPGIRSDSDLFTFGYGWKPWEGPLIATADEILNYLDEALDEQNIREHIRYRHQVEDASWSSEEKQWTLRVRDDESGEDFFLQVTSCGCVRVITAIQKVTHQTSRAWTSSRDGSCIPRHGRRIWTTPTGKSLSSVPARRRRP